MVERDIGKRFNAGIPHNEKSVEIMAGIGRIDFYNNGDSLKLRTGYDTDNGETLLYLLDIYFECIETGEKI